MHDGGLILAFPDRYLGLFLAFQTQRVPTDATGQRRSRPNSDRQILPAGDRHRRPDGPVYLERALLNPCGDDPGKEIVVLANLATTAAALNGWRLVDKNHRVTP